LKVSRCTSIFTLEQ